MKKWFLIIATIIIVIVLVIPLVLPKKYTVERSIIINKSRKEVYSKLINLETWPEWSPWNALDPEAEYEVIGPVGVVGTYSTWKGEKIGTGQQTLTQLVEPEFILFALEFMEPQQGVAKSTFKLNEVENGTEVVWDVTGNLSYPLERYMGLMMDSMLGKAFDKGLQSLKENLEQ